MNLMEVGSFFGGLGGAISVATYGFDLYGWVGLVLGIPIGYIIGFFISVFIIFSLFFMGIVKERLHQRWKLKSTFGRYWSRNKKEKWHQLSSNIICSEKVDGKVICKFYYGVFLNTNHGFPALLNSYNMTDDMDTIKIGDRMSVFIKSLDYSESFIVLSQKIAKMESENV